MNDKFDSLIEKAIEAEKQLALRHFHLSPLHLSPNHATKEIRHTSVLRLKQTLIWGGCAATLLLTLGTVLLLHYQGHPSTVSFTSHNLELSLRSIQRTQPGPVLPATSSFSGEGTSSDLSWNIQWAVCRLQRSYYAGQDLKTAILRTLSRGTAPNRSEAGLEKEVIRGLDGKLRKLSSTRAVECALLRISR
jgi:hypothetical protein